MESYLYIYKGYIHFTLHWCRDKATKLRQKELKQGELTFQVTIVPENLLEGRQNHRHCQFHLLSLTDFEAPVL